MHKEAAADMQNGDATREAMLNGEVAEGQEELDFDALLATRVGEFGRKQCLLSMLLVSSAISSCVHALASVFLAGVPDHWCSTQDEAFINCSESEIKILTVPQKHQDGQSSFSQCEIFQHNLTGSNVAEYCGSGNATLDSSQWKSVSCDQWSYDTSVFSKNIITEWDLVCSRAGYVSTVAAVFMVGRIIGCVFAGQVADRFGRKWPMRMAAVGVVVACLLLCAMPNYAGFLAITLCISILVTIRDNISVILAVELVGPSWRVLVVIIWLLFWSVGYLVLAALAYAITGWRYQQAAFTIPDVLLLIAYFMFAPESPRWLLVKNRLKEAMEIIKDIAKGNGKQVPETVKAHAQDESGTTYLDLLRTPCLRWISLILFYNWFANAFVYYGLSLNTSALGGSPYFNFLLSGAVEFPAYIFMWVSFSRIGRLGPFGYIFILGGVSLLAIIAVPPDKNWLVVTFAMIGKFAIAASFGMVWMYSLEVYPTSVRSLGVNLCSTFARISSVPASYVGMLSGISRELPLLIFGAMALLGGALVFVLPETRDQPMRQTVHEGEEFIRANMCQYGVCKRCRRKEAPVTPTPTAV